MEGLTVLQAEVTDACFFYLLAPKETEYCIYLNTRPGWIFINSYR